MEVVYNLRIKIEQLEDGDYRYMATSPDLPNLIVAGDTIDEVLAEAPAVARALIETMRETGQPVPETLKVEAMPYQANLPIAV
ncbi:MAG: type II toxin-antitoxin system HicB family antitoxin [Chloroflexi bacterium]|nr:type II toxin-antitoxin system HicB family antitoxin [Chloroflexota bacterium]